MAFIQTFVRISCLVTSAPWMVAVPCCSPRALVLLSPLRCHLVSLSPGCQMKDNELQFLESICILCRSSTELSLEFFCQRYQLAEKVEVKAGQHTADELLLSEFFYLPPEEEMTSLEVSLYTQVSAG